MAMQDLMCDLNALKEVLAEKDDVWTSEVLHDERNQLQQLFSRTERLTRTLQAARRENEAIVLAVRVIKARIDARA